MKRKLLVSGVIISTITSAFAISCREEPVSSTLSKVQTEYDNKICQARLELAHLAVDYLSSITELEDNWKIQRQRRNSKEEEMLCNMLTTLEGTDPNCFIPDHNRLIRLKMQVNVTATALRNGRIHYQEKVKTIQREFLLSLGIYDPTQHKSEQLAKLPSCAGDEDIEAALKQLPST